MIPNVNFVQTYNPNYGTYNRNSNTLNVYLPHLQEYAVIARASEAHSLYFGNFDNQAFSGDFAILRMTFDEISSQIKTNGEKTELH